MNNRDNGLYKLIMTILVIASITSLSLEGKACGETGGSYEYNYIWKTWECVYEE